jgi:hypothetical protein
MRAHCELSMVVTMMSMPDPMMMAAMLFLDFNRLSASGRAGLGVG